MNAEDIELALRSRAAFNESVEHLDADTRRRLREARLRAQQGETRRTGSRWIWPTGAALTAALALAVFLPPRLAHAPTATTSAPAVVVAPLRASPAVPTNSDTETAAQTGAPDMAEASSPETADPDMLNDLDFYGWLAKQQDNGKTGG
jgi:hypothetical protein